MDWSGLVAEREAGGRLDAWLALRLSVSRAEARRMLARQQVRINARLVNEADKSRALAAGEAVTVADFVPPALQWPVAQPELAAPVLAEGQGWVIFDKPAGMPVHPLSPDEQGTLLNLAAARYPSILGVGEGGLRSGVVHRLDVETSGCVLLATAADLWPRLRERFERHTAIKRYVALVHGQLTGQGRDARWLRVAQHHPARVRVVEGGGTARPRDARRCTQSWRVLETRSTCTLVEIDLGTGFLHQIRAIFADRGHPVVGDRVYGRQDGAPRLMLHAAELRADPAAARSPIPSSFDAVE